MAVISSCPEGAPFSQRSLRKSVATFWRKIVIFGKWLMARGKAKPAGAVRRDAAG